MRRMIPGILIEKIKSLFTSIWNDDQGNVKIGKNLKVDGNASFGKITKFANEGFVIYEGSIKGYSDPKPGYYTDDRTLWFYVEGSASSPRAYCSGITSALGGLLFMTIENDGEPQYKQIPTTDRLPKLYRHHLTLTTSSGSEDLDYYAKTSLVADSIQDLTTITGGHPFGSGYKYASNVWKKGTENVTAVADDVQAVLSF